MGKLWVPYEIAADLKVNGFREITQHYYLVNSEDPTKHTNTPTFGIKEPFGMDYNNHLPTRISAPFWPLVTAWFRTNHGLSLEPKKKGLKEIFYSFQIKKEGEQWYDGKEEYATYDMATFEGIKRLLKSI